VGKCKILETHRGGYVYAKKFLPVLFNFLFNSLGTNFGNQSSLTWSCRDMMSISEYNKIAAMREKLVKEGKLPPEPRVEAIGGGGPFRGAGYKELHQT